MRAIITHGNGQSALAILRSLGRNKIDTAVMASNKKALSFYSKYCNQKIISNYNIEFFSKLRENDMVMPVDEDVMLLLAKNKSKVKCILPFSDYPTLNKLINKSLMVKHAIESNITSPRSYFVNNSDDIDKIKSELEFPVVIKPNRGTGGTGINIVNSPAKLKDTFKYVLANYGPSFIQEKIPYVDKYKVEYLLNDESRIRRVCVTKINRNYPLDTGPSCCVETVKKPDVLRAGMKFLEPLDYYGIADFDFVIDERTGKPVLMEINPRFWGSLQSAITAGVDFPYLLYKMVEEGDIDTSLNYRTGVKSRYVLFNDLRYTLEILKGNYTTSHKLRTIVDFLNFYQDDSYYIFTLEDFKPFLAFLYHKF